VALNAGGAALFLQYGQDRRTAAREQIKTRIQIGGIKLACATDAVCKGLNLEHSINMWFERSIYVAILESGVIRQAPSRNR
jgi:hypothetical protein